MEGPTAKIIAGKSDETARYQQADDFRRPRCKSDLEVAVSLFSFSAALMARSVVSGHTPIKA
jgi:hypothetical protein